MGRKKEVVIKNERYSGKYLSDEICEKLEKLLKLDSHRGSVADLKHIICELTPSEVDFIKKTKYSNMVEPREGTLTDLQTIGVAYMFFAKDLILGDSVGIGKTVEVAGLCNLLEKNYTKRGIPFRFLFLTEKNIVSQARDELIKFTGNYVDTVYGVKQDVSRFIEENSEWLEYSVVGTHSLIKSKPFQEWILGYTMENGYCPFDLLVIDESGDILKNSASQYYKEGKILADMVERVVLLNATPFEGELSSFYNQLSFIDDSLLPPKYLFSKEYEIMDYRFSYPKPTGKYRNAEKFRSLVSYRYLARTRKMSGAVMVGCTAELVEVPLSKEQRYLLNMTSMPGMVYDCPSYFKMGIDTNVETTPKVKALVNILTTEWKDIKSILIYSRYKEAQSSLRKALREVGIESSIMNGDFSQSAREDIVNKFKLGDIRVLITNVQKGLNFGNCSHCIFYSYDPNPNSMVQFEGRMTRSYNIENKHVKLLVSKGSELKSVEGIISDRAKASDLFAGSDFSCILSLLTDNEMDSEAIEVKH